MYMGEQAQYAESVQSDDDDQWKRVHAVLDRNQLQVQYKRAGQHTDEQQHFLVEGSLVKTR